MKLKRLAKDINALTKVDDLLLWIIRVLEKFPRSQKFLIADRIKTGLLNVQELIIQSIYTNKNTVFKTGKSKIETITICFCF